jgi:hypothetical protein
MMGASWFRDEVDERLCLSCCREVSRTVFPSEYAATSLDGFLCSEARATYGLMLSAEGKICKAVWRMFWNDASEVEIEEEVGRINESLGSPLDWEFDLIPILTREWNRFRLLRYKRR